MSLQLWMPLTKDLRQQGVSGITPTQTTGYTSVAAGKLGGCYKFTGTFDTLLPLSNWNWTEGSVSFGCWAKISQSELATLVNAATYDATYNSMGGTLLGRDSYGGIGLRWKTNNIYSTSTLNAVYIYVHMRNTSSSSNNTSQYTIPFDTWFHVMTVIDRTENKIKVYINGELFTSTNLTVTGTFTTGTFRIAEATWDGGNGRSSAGCWHLNDVRVYDHALSQMEVKELAKGLVLHYPLADTYAEATTNLITTEDCLSSTCYNGATSKYGYGTNTDMYKTVTTYDGRKGTKVYMGTNGNAAFPYVYINNMYTSDGTNSPAYKTLSFDYYTNIGTSIRPYKLGSGSGTATYRITNKNGVATGTGTDAVSIPIVTNGWNHIEITFHGITAADSQWGYIQNYPSHTSNTNNFWFFANMQLETKDHATGYAGVGGTRTPTIVYDCSGFCNNGVINGSLNIDSDTPKYAVSTHMDATTTKIHISNFPTSGFGNSYSFAWWAKISSVTPMHWGFSDGIRLNGMYTGRLWNTGDSSNNPLYNIGTTTQVTAPTVNEWHHWVMTGNGTKCYVYQDGELWAEAKTYKAISGTSIYINGWNNATNYSSNNYSISDFRIYATALSASDVKSLYQNCATIDPDGTIRGQIRS